MKIWAVRIAASGFDEQRALGDPVDRRARRRALRPQLDQRALGGRELPPDAVAREIVSRFGLAD